MAAVIIPGYRSGPREIRKLKIGNTARAISIGSILVEDGAGPAYHMAGAAGELPRAIALQPVALADIPATDGNLEIECDVSEQAIYEYAVGNGTLLATDEGKTCDIYTDRSLDVDATADDVFRIVKADLTRNTCLGKFNFNSTRTGV